MSDFNLEYKDWLIICRTDKGFAVQPYSKDSLDLMRVYSDSTIFKSWYSNLNDIKKDINDIDLLRDSLTPELIKKANDKRKKELLNKIKGV